MTAAPALDYARLAALYDEYCVFAGDVELFRRWTRTASGPILELMAGTGRLSLPLAADGADLICLDSSLAMLVAFRRKLAGRPVKARLICADALDLPLRARFDLVLLPFQGFTELATPADQLGLLESVSRVLAREGRFVCTSHNPSVRRRTVDDAWHQVAELPARDGGVIHVALRTHWDDSTGNVVGTQRITRVEPSGERTELSLDLRFSLVSAEQLTTLAEAAGLRVVSWLGDYGGGEYDPATSSAMIAVLAPCD